MDQSIVPLNGHTDSLISPEQPFYPSQACILSIVRETETERETMFSSLILWFLAILPLFWYTVQDKSNLVKRLCLSASLRPSSRPSLPNVFHLS